MANGNNGWKWGILIFILVVLVIVIVLALIPWGKLGFGASNCGKCSSSKSASYGKYSGSLGRYSGTLSSSSGATTSQSSYSVPSSADTINSQSYTYVSPSTEALSDMIEGDSSPYEEGDNASSFDGSFDAESDNTYSPSEDDEPSGDSTYHPGHGGYGSDGYGSDGYASSSKSKKCSDQVMLPDACSTYNVDLSDPNVYLYRPQIVRPLRTRQYQTADVWRGDIPISPDPCKTGQFQSQYAQPASLKYDAYFSGMCAPGRRGDIAIVNEGTIMDHTPKRYSSKGACGGGSCGGGFSTLQPMPTKGCQEGVDYDIIA